MSILAGVEARPAQRFSGRARSSGDANCGVDPPRSDRPLQRRRRRPDARPAVRARGDARLCFVDQQRGTLRRSARCPERAAYAARFIAALAMAWTARGCRISLAATIALEPCRDGLAGPASREAWTRSSARRSPTDDRAGLAVLDPHSTASSRRRSRRPERGVNWPRSRRDTDGSPRQRVTSRDRGLLSRVLRRKVGVGGSDDVPLLGFRFSSIGVSLRSHPAATAPTRCGVRRRGRHQVVDRDRTAELPNVDSPGGSRPAMQQRRAVQQARTRLVQKSATP